MKTRLLLPIVFIMIAIVAGNQLVSHLNPATATPPTPATPSPDFYLSGFATQSFDTQGRIDNIIQGQHLAYFSKEKSSHIQRPMLQVFDAEHGAWNLNGEQAIVDSDKRMTFQGRVLIERTSGQPQPPLTIQTQDLVVDINASRAETRAAVRLEGSNKTVTASGLIMHFSDPAEIELLADVRAEYEPYH